MVNQELQDRPVRMRSRPIAAADRDALVALLNKGFGMRRTRRFWERFIDRLDRRAVPDGLPRFGYLLENAGRVVGAVLLIFSGPRAGGEADVRCNISTWYVEPAFRSYAALLASQALRHKTVTYLNISPAANTRRTIEAQGYTRYSDGVFLAIPALARNAGPGVHIVAADRDPGADAAPFERDLVTRHAAYGCIAFWCVADGRAHPFVFRRRFIKGLVPCAQLIYCGDVADIVRFAAPVGRHLLAHGCPFVAIDANAPLPGLAGRYMAGWKPKYFKGPHRPRLGDLADTEAALFGI
jgi:hypothetical protein